MSLKLKYMKKKILFFAFIIISITAKSQDKIYMPYFQVENMHWQYQISATKIFKTYLNMNNKYELVLPELKDSIYSKETFEQTVANASALNAKYFLIGEMNALNEVMIVSLTLYNTNDKSKVWSDVLKAKTPDDLDPILQKIANNFNTETKSANTDDIYSVTQYDSKELTKVQATTNFGVSISGAFSMLSDVKNISSAGFGLILSHDLRDVILDVQGDFLFGDVRIYDIRISGLYPFKKARNTPYIGGSIAWQGTSVSFKSNTDPDYYVNYDSNGGLGMFINGGYIFNRTSNVNFRINSSLNIPFYEVKDEFPVYLMINAAILF